jgi:hypothetical protein
MKACGGVDVQIHTLLTSALVGGECSASRPGRFTPGESPPPSVPIGQEAGWVPQPVWTTWGRKIYDSTGTRELQTLNPYFPEYETGMLAT